MRAAIEGHMEVCRLLLEHGAKSNLIVQVRVTPSKQFAAW